MAPCSHEMEKLVIIIVFITVCNLGSVKSQQFQLASQTPDDCNRGDNDQYHQFFDYSQMKCQDCSQTTAYQTVSEDGLRCICQPGLKLNTNFGGISIQCTPCADEKQIVDNSGWECIECTTSSNPNICPSCDRRGGDVTDESKWQCVECGAGTSYNPATKECTPCPELTIPVERNINGSWTSTLPTRTCQSCADFTMPAEGEICERCNQILSVLPLQSDCACPENQYAGGVCFQEAGDLADDKSSQYRLSFGDTDLDSAYFFDNVRAADGMCKEKYGNLTACQLLGNLCTMILYTTESGSSGGTDDACAMYLSLAEEGGGEWPKNMPWLYYADPATQILEDTRISTEFTFPESKLNFKVASYALDGTFLGIKSVEGGLLQLCSATDEQADAAYIFGTTYNQKCKIYLEDLFSNTEYPSVFYDMYLEYETADKKYLHPIPVLVENFKSAAGDEENKEEDRTNWQLTRRFFLVDNISGRPTGSDTGEAVSSVPKAIRYASSMTINVQLRNDKKEGKIYPPYLKINYAVAQESDIDKTVQVAFNVEYSMNLDKYNNDVGIAIGVLSAFAIVYSALQTWGYYKRSGLMAIDLATLFKFVLFGMNNIANVFFVVSFGTAFWWLVFFKQQSTVYLMVPTRSQESSFIGYLVTGCVLKLLHLFHLIYCQVTVDIFLLDWERPKGKILASNNAQQKGTEPPVSVWRTYFIANEWNEIQTVRKKNAIFQIFAVMFFLHVVGFENYATADPQKDLNKDELSYYAQYSRIFRFALAASVWLILAVVQWIFYTFIYERFIEDKVRQYVDLCSLSNVSVFILENNQFGYYIHGHSAFGTADTGMREMYNYLEKEKNDLCGQRGLEPNTEDQTFQIAVPKRLRDEYERVIHPIIQAGKRAGGPAGGLPPGAGPADQQEFSFRAYDTLNRFLQSYIDHSLKEVDYLIKDKTLFESILNVEFGDSSFLGHFYKDNGHSFDAVLFYGHETSITIFEILFFGVVDVMSGSYILAAVLTYLIMEFLQLVRDNTGRTNLAKKTLVDNRFLI